MFRVCRNAGNIRAIKLPATDNDKRSTTMETNMTTEKALDILERHNLWRRGADYVDATDPRLLGMALDKAIEVLRLSNVVGQSEQLVCDHQWKSRFSEKRGSWRLCTKCSKEG